MGKGKYQRKKDIIGMDVLISNLISDKCNYSLIFVRIFTFLLSSDIRSEGSIAIVKKFDFDFFIIFDSISLPQSKNVF